MVYKLKIESTEKSSRSRVQTLLLTDVPAYAQTKTTYRDGKLEPCVEKFSETGSVVDFAIATLRSIEDVETQRMTRISEEDQEEEEDTMLSKAKFSVSDFAGDSVLMNTLQIAAKIAVLRAKTQYSSTVEWYAKEHATLSLSNQFRERLNHISKLYESTKENQPGVHSIEPFYVEFFSLLYPDVLLHQKIQYGNERIELRAEDTLLVFCALLREPGFLDGFTKKGISGLYLKAMLDEILDSYYSCQDSSPHLLILSEIHNLLGSLEPFEKFYTSYILEEAENTEQSIETIRENQKSKLLEKLLKVSKTLVGERIILDEETVYLDLENLKKSLSVDVLFRQKTRRI